MYAVTFKLKNGKKINGLIWTFRPENGYFEALDESNGQVKKYQFNDIDSGKVFPDHIRSPHHETKDLLEQASQEGWKPKQ